VISRRHPIARSTKPIRRRAPVRKRRAKPRRTTALRCPTYIAWLHKQRCEHCGSLNPDPAHGPAAGRSLKGPDNYALPLCRQVHEFLDGQARLPNGKWGRRAALAWLGWNDSGMLDGERCTSNEQAEASWRARALFWWTKFCRETGCDLATGRKVRR